MTDAITRQDIADQPIEREEYEDWERKNMATNWQPIDTAPRDGTRIEIRYTYSRGMIKHEDLTAYWGAKISFSNDPEHDKIEGWRNQLSGGLLGGLPSFWRPVSI